MRTFAPIRAVGARSRIYAKRKVGFEGGAAMTTARDIMHPEARCVGEHETLANAAQLMRDLDIGALPVCGDDDRLHGIITDRDIVVKCVAAGGDPATTTAGSLAQGTPVHIEADEDADQVLRVMEEHRIRRLPVIDNHRLVGIICEADLARHMSEQAVGHFVEEVCASP
jgi:CBS domain-containing protein